MLDIKITGVKQTLRIITRLNKEVENLSGYFQREALPLLATEVRRIFSTGGYGRWAPLAPSTIRRKGHARILVDTYRYRKAATPRVRSGDAIALVSTRLFASDDDIVEVNRNSLRVQVLVPYAEYHEFGSGRLRRPVYRLIARNETFRRGLTSRLDARLQKLIK